MSRRVVITSIGVISSLGFTPGQIIDNLKNGKVAFKRSSFDDSVVTCPVGDFDIKKFTGPFKDRRYLNRGAQFSTASAMEAVKNAGIDEKLLGKAGLFTGAGPNLDIGGEFPQIQEGKLDRKDLMALWILRFLPNTAASSIARLTGIHGENIVSTAACAASLQAIGEAFRKIKDGYLDLAFAGGGDSRLSSGGLLAYKKAYALFAGDADPQRASRPFDSKRAGFVPGEGGAFFLLEEMSHAQRRGGKMYGEISGFGSSIDGHAMTAPDPDGKWGETAVSMAFHEAGISPDQVDVVSAHGTGTLLNDAMEANMINRIYGRQSPYVIALKSWIGHISAACGALELAISLICMQNDYLPEIRNLDDPCHPNISFVQKGKTCSPKTMVVENFGFGGHNSALIVKKV
jgi:3-oxoacyl-[acyl-carrier-protein] synthase II